MKDFRFILFFFCVGFNTFFVDAQNKNTSIDEKVHSKNLVDKPIIMAHRMAPLKRGYAEDSMETLEYNMKNFPNAIQEIDVQITSDNKVVLLHDNTLERTTTGKGCIGSYTYNDLKNIYLKDGYGNVLYGQNIPLLEDVLKITKGKVFVMLDVKPGVDINVVMDIVKKTDTFDNLAIICYSVEDGLRMNKTYPDLMIALGFNSIDDIRRIKQAGIPYNKLIALVPKVMQKQSFYDEIIEMGVPISFSAQGNMDIKPDALDHYKSIIKKGITILCTDSLSRAFEALYYVQ